MHNSDKENQTNLPVSVGDRMMAFLRYGKLSQLRLSTSRK